MFNSSSSVLESETEFEIECKLEEEYVCKCEFECEGECECEFEFDGECEDECEDEREDERVEDFFCHQEYAIGDDGGHGSSESRFIK